MIIGTFVVGMARAWQFLSVGKTGVGGWLNLLQMCVRPLGGEADGSREELPVSADQPCPTGLAGHVPISRP